MPGRAAALPLFVAVVAVALACGGGASAPEPSPSSAASPTARATPSPVTPTPDATATPTPTAADAGWWEEGSATPDAERPDSRIWNVRAEETAPGEALLSFDYFLSLAPEANVFVHMGANPDVGITLLDAAGETLGGVTGVLQPTEFGDDTVGGAASFTDVAVERFADIAAARICIRVFTGDYSEFMGRPELLCEPFPVERVGR